MSKSVVGDLIWIAAPDDRLEQLQVETYGRLWRVTRAATGAHHCCALPFHLSQETYPEQGLLADLPGFPWYDTEYEPYVGQVEEDPADG